MEQLTCRTLPDQYDSVNTTSLKQSEWCVCGAGFVHNAGHGIHGNVPLAIYVTPDGVACV